MNYRKKSLLALLLVWGYGMNCIAQQTDANAPLHLLKPDYKIPYQVPCN